MNRYFDQDTGQKGFDLTNTSRFATDDRPCFARRLCHEFCKIHYGYKDFNLQL
jgi:hypothetical protein